MKHSDPRRMAFQMPSHAQIIPKPASEMPIGAAVGFSLMRRMGEIDALVEASVASWHRAAPVIENRRWHRVAYEKRIAVVELDNVTSCPVGDMKLAWGHDICPGGISFVHTQPLTCRRVAVTFLLDDGSNASVVVNLTWCRFRRQGEYQSGGSFQRTIDLGTEALDWAKLPPA